MTITTDFHGFFPVVNHYEPDNMVISMQESRQEAPPLRNNDVEKRPEEIANRKISCKRRRSISDASQAPAAKDRKIDPQAMQSAESSPIEDEHMEQQTPEGIGTPETVPQVAELNDALDICLALERLERLAELNLITNNVSNLNIR